MIEILNLKPVNIEYWDLEFIWDLLFGAWNFLESKT